MFMTKDKAVALMNSDLSGRFAYPANFFGTNLSDGTHFCPGMNSNCSKCATLPETATVHAYCLKLYLAQATPARGRIRRLWDLIVRRRPWRSSPAMRLPAEGNHQRIMARAGTFEGLEFLACFPAEIGDMVGQYLTSSSLAQACAVEDVFRQLEYNFVRDDISLANVQTWSRGEVPVITTNPREPPIPTIICIDWKGIQSIQQQRFPETRLEGYGVTKDRWFITLKDTSQIKASFKVGPDHTHRLLERPPVSLKPN